jgi:hypothetical protein
LKTKSVGVRISVKLLERIQSENPGFNLSAHVRNSLIREFGSIEDKVDQILRLKEKNNKNNKWR